MSVLEGTVAFSNVTSHDVYNGQSTGRYSLTLTLRDEDREALQTAGVKIKDYEGNGQRKFATKHPVRLMDAEGNPLNTEIPRGSLVRVKYKLGQEHPVHGVSTYLQAVKVLEFADFDGEDDEDF